MEYRKELGHTLAKLVGDGLIDRTSIQVFMRPKYFNQFAFSIGFVPDMYGWMFYDEIIERIKQTATIFDAKVIENSTTRDVMIYGNDPIMIDHIVRNNENFTVSYIRITNEKAWHYPPVKTKPKPAKFYGTHSYRIRMKKPDWGIYSDNLDQISHLDIDYKLTIRQYTDGLNNIIIKDTFIYVDKTSELLALRLVIGSQISEISKR